MSILDEQVSPPAVVPTAARAGVLRPRPPDPVAVVSVVFIALVALLSALAPLLTDRSPTASKITEALAPMGGAHLLGTDGVGRDVFAQLLYGGRTSLIGAVIVVVVALVLGLPAGHPGRLLPGSVRRAGQLGEQPVHGPARDHRAAGRARAVRPQHRAGHGRVRRADRPGGLPADPGLGDRRARGALRRRRPRLRPG